MSLPTSWCIGLLSAVKNIANSLLQKELLPEEFALDELSNRLR